MEKTWECRLPEAYHVEIQLNKDEKLRISFVNIFQWRDIAKTV